MVYRICKVVWYTATPITFQLFWLLHECDFLWLVKAFEHEYRLSEFPDTSTLTQHQPIVNDMSLESFLQERVEDKPTRYSTHIKFLYSRNQKSRVWIKVRCTGPDTDLSFFHTF